MSNPKNLQLSEQDITEILYKERIEAFSAGYAKHVSLSQLEIDKLILAWQLQQASCIVYWTGWFLENKVTYQSVVDAVVKMLQLEGWLQEINLLNVRVN